MKIRNGFVSNSSSSSFIVSIAPESDIEKESALLFEFFINSIKSSQYKDNCLPNNFKGTVEHYTGLLQHEREELNKDVTWLEKEVVVLKNISDNQDAVDLFEYWSKRHGNKNYPSRYVRDTEERQKKYGWGDEGIEGEIDRIKSEIKRKKKQSDEILTKITNMSSLPIDNEVVSINIDNMDQNREILKKIFGSSWITVIEESHR